MGTYSSILIILLVYAIILLSIVTIHRIRPGIGLYEKRRPGDLSWLAIFYVTNIALMSVPTLFIAHVPAHLLIFPEKINVDQAIAFLLTWILISILPWRKFSVQFPIEILSSHGEIYLYAISRLLFLACYEWFFRGLLLYSCRDLFGSPAAVVINISLYALAHFHKCRKEIVACIPFGLLLCVFTLWWHSVWPAIILHVLVVTVSEWPPLQQFISSQKQTAL